MLSMKQTSPSYLGKAPCYVAAPRFTVEQANNNKKFPRGIFLERQHSFSCHGGENLPACALHNVSLTPLVLAVRTLLALLLASTSLTIQRTRSRWHILGNLQLHYSRASRPGISSKYRHVGWYLEWLAAVSANLRQERSFVHYWCVSRAWWRCMWIPTSTDQSVHCAHARCQFPGRS